MNPISERLGKTFFDFPEQSTHQFIADECKRGLDPSYVFRDLLAPAIVELEKDWNDRKIPPEKLRRASKNIFHASTRAKGPLAPTFFDHAPLLIGNTCAVHTIGMELLYSYLASNLFNVRYIGKIGSVMNLLEKIRETRPSGLLISCPMCEQAALLVEIRDAIPPNVKMAMGGCSIHRDPDLPMLVGADYCGKSIQDAHRIVNKMID